MKTSIRTARLPALIGLIASVIFGLTATAAGAVVAAIDRDGFSQPTDASCWLNPACSVTRGGNSDVMTVYAPDGSIFAQAFAFGAEEFTSPTSNVYYFNPALVLVNPGLVSLPSGLADQQLPNGSTPLSDIFGIALTPLGPALAFSSGFPVDQSYWPVLPGFPVCSSANDGCSLECPQPTLTPGFGVIECPDILNPVPELGAEGGDSRFLTIPYDATQYLSLEWQQLGFRADFRSDTVPEPATLALLGIGLAGLGFSRRQCKQ